MNNYTGLYNRFGVEYKKKAIEVQTNMLLNYAPSALTKAYETRSFNNRTWNLADSYVWAVYYKGGIKGSGYLWNVNKAQTDSTYKSQKINGRKLASEFASSYHSSFSNGWEIVWAATAPYAPILEAGTKKGKFYVISQMYDNVTADLLGKAIVTFNTDKIV